jgi:hypothetical protein
VLQIDHPPVPSKPARRRKRPFVHRIESSVEALAAKESWIRGALEVEGFSRAGKVLYAITHPGQAHLAAAIAADFFVGTRSQLTMLR